MNFEHLDIAIIGAGLSGIGAARHLGRAFPDRRIAILEARESIGGTWDLFRYPGIRSDSDMYTLGYNFKPWRGAKAIADGDSILTYVHEAARESGADRLIRFRHRLVTASWSSADRRWTLTLETGPQRQITTITCSFLMMCSGYYRFDRGHEPDFPGLDRFKGRIVHPQNWPSDLDHAGKRVIVIGSGATAVTIVPEMARTADHVTMVQRSPSYVVARPSQDRIANRLRRVLPASIAYGLTRWKNVLLQMYFYRRARRQPDGVRAAILHMAQRDLGPDVDAGQHFSPAYKPWDQRLCLAPDGDLFVSLREKRASVVTGQIETFQENGLRLESGEEIPADIIVTATGLDLQFLGGAKILIDGQPFEPARALTYKGMMYEGVPNLVSVFGYTNASWTLKCDLTCEYAVRLIRHMDRRGLRQVVPRRPPGEIATQPWLDFSSGYVQRSADRFPRQGDRAPWRLHQNYVRDILELRFAKLDTPELSFQ